MKKEVNADLAAVINEINAGLPPAPAAQEQLPPEGVKTDWADQLRKLQAPQMPLPAGGPQWNEADILAAVQDKAAQTQDRVLSSMFGDVLPAKRNDTSNLPGAIDRYLDKVLST